MRHLFFTGFTFGALVPIALAQFPPAVIRDPSLLPPSVSAPKSPEKPRAGQAPLPTVGPDGLPLPRLDVALARVENAKPLGRIEVKFLNNMWQVVVGANAFANLGTDWKAAEKTANTLQAMQAGDSGKATMAEVQNTSWATIGVKRPVVGYMTVRGEAVRSFNGILNTSLSIDLAKVRAEEVRGVWVVRDEHNILLNFGEERREAEQAVAVVTRYGFNRLGFVGGTDTPSLRYFFAAKETNAVAKPNEAKSAQAAAFQEAALDRAGIEIPGFGNVGQKVNLDVKKLDVQKDGADFILVHSGDVLAKFGRDEWSARDALRVVQKMEPTAIVHVGSPGITFFLKGTDPPNRLPFGTTGAAFYSDRLTPRQTADGAFHFYDTLGREIASVKTQKEADAVRAAIKHFALNRTCQIGKSPATSLTFLSRVN